MPTKVYITLKTYDSFGGDNAISLIGDLLSLDAPDCGDAVEEIDIEACFSSTRGPKKTLESIYEEFHSGLAALPKSRFQRKKKLLVLEYESRACKAEQLRKAQGASAKVLKQAFAELREQLAPALKKKLKKGDDFNRDAFLDWVDRQGEQVPKNKGELEALRARVEASRQAELDSMDEWEKLGLDWDEFHPEAREVLSDPWLWRQADDFAPNGNDTGADVLSMYRDWRMKNRRRSSKTFFNDLLAAWEVDPRGKDDYSRKVHSEAILGLAFAHLKLEARLPLWAQKDALASIERRSKALSKEHPDWHLLEERLATYDRIAERLRSAPTSGNS